MNASTNPYLNDLAGREPLGAMRDTIADLNARLREWPADRFELSYGPGKWTARQVLIHLAQTELALGVRARMAVATPGYAAQAWDQDSWIAFDGRLTGVEALDAFVAVARMNLKFFEGLSADQRARSLTHPEYGTLTVDWIIHQMAGHQIHHLEQIDRIAE
jgi:hypothetical protein